MNNTLIKEGDFRMIKNTGGTEAFIKAYQLPFTDDSLIKKGDVEEWMAPPLISQQEYFNESFGNVGSETTRFEADSTIPDSSAAIFSVVKLENVWKQEIEFSQSLSRILRLYYHLKIKNQGANLHETLDHLLFDENIKLFQVFSDYLVNEPPDQLKPAFGSGKVVKLRNNLLYHKHLLSATLLYLLKFYDMKKADDAAQNGETKLSPNDIIIKEKQNKLKAMLFKVYRFMLEGQKPPILYTEYIIKYYTVGEDYASYLDFFRAVFKELEHPYRSKDLNFKVRMISHYKPIANLCNDLVVKIINKEFTSDPHEAFDLLMLITSPNSIPYGLNQDNLYIEIDDSFINKKTFLAHFKFRYEDNKILIERTGPGEVCKYPLNQFNTFSEEDRKFIIHYMKMIASMADLNVMPWLKCCIGDDSLPLIEFIKDTSIDFDLRSEFMNVILQSFKNSIRGRTISSNSFHPVNKIEDKIQDDFWEVEQKDSLQIAKDVYPIMLSNPQDFRSMYTNISFETQKIRFFSSMLKYNMFFDMGVDRDEWINKVFDHTCKMILLAVLKYMTKLHSSKTHKSYEVTESFPQDYSSQRSVFDLHFWFRTVINKSSHTSENQDDESNHKEKSGIDDATTQKILTESFEILHYFVELRHKHLTASVNEKVHKNTWAKNLSKESNSLIDGAKVVDLGNDVCKTVLDSIENEEDTMSKWKHFPTVMELYQDFISLIRSNDQEVAFLQEHSDLGIHSIPESFDNFLMKILRLSIMDTNLQQSCITLIAKIQSEPTLRFRKLEKAQFTSSDTSFKFTSLLASISNTSNFDHRCVPGVDLEIQDLNTINEPELKDGEYKSQYSFTKIVTCLTQIKNWTYMNYTVDNIYDNLMRNYETKQKAYIEPNAQDAASCLKLYDILMWILHRFRIMAEFSTFSFSNITAAVDRLTRLQPLLFTKIFSCLQAMCYKNEKMKKIMWKNKEFFLLEKRGLLEQYGELSLISIIIDNPVLLLKDNTLDSFTNTLVKRMSKENFPSVLDIMAKISKASMNSTISTVAMDILTDGPISKSVGSLDEHSHKTFSNLCIILNNLLKSNRTIILRNKLCKVLTLDKLCSKVIAMSEDYSKKLTDVSDIPEKKDPEAESRRTDIEDSNERRRIFFMETQIESSKERITVENYAFVFAKFSEDFNQTSDEIVGELQLCYESLFSVYNLIYFNFFINHIEQSDQLVDLHEEFLKPLNQFMYSKNDYNIQNVHVLLSKNITEFLKNIGAYLKVISEKSMIRDSQESLLDNWKDELERISKVVQTRSRVKTLKLNNSKEYNFNQNIVGRESLVLPESVLRAPHGRNIEATFYRDTEFEGETKYWMESMNFVNNQNEKLGEYKFTYHDKYEKDWFNEYYTAQNFRSVWYNALQKIISSKVARGLVQKDFEHSA